MPLETKDAALGKSISFRPGSLYSDAVAYGLSQTPARNPSEVCCEALTHLFEVKGFKTQPANEQAELLAAAAEIGLPEALKILRKRLRSVA